MVKPLLEICDTDSETHFDLQSSLLELENRKSGTGNVHPKVRHIIFNLFRQSLKKSCLWHGFPLSLTAFQFFFAF